MKTPSELIGGRLFFLLCFLVMHLASPLPLREHPHPKMSCRRADLGLSGLLARASTGQGLPYKKLAGCTTQPNRDFKSW